MGVWLGALGRLEIIPEPDEHLLREFAVFSRNSCPKEYREDEVFANTWFFDAENRLASTIGKFAEPSVWYRHLKKEFFGPRGFCLEGDPMIVGECDLDIWDLQKERNQEKAEWERRASELLSQ